MNFGVSCVCVCLFMKARERASEREMEQTNSQLQQEISELRDKVKSLEDDLSAARNQHSLQAKVPFTSLRLSLSLVALMTSRGCYSSDGNYY